MPPKERPLTLARALAPDVPERTRAKGSAYFNRGAVVSIRGFEHKVTAIVYGTAEYHVEITREQDGFFSSCECPYFQDRFSVCKHIWAVVLAADSRGLLTPIGHHAWIEPVDTPGERDGPDAAMADVQPGAAGKPRPAPWEHFLEDVSQQLDASDARRPAARYATAQFLYVLDRETTETGNGIAIDVLARRPKKSGEWGKPQPAAIGPEEIDQLPDEADREILALLMGATDSPAYDPYYSSTLVRISVRSAGMTARRGYS
jgi:hypothetical protein